MSGILGDTGRTWSVAVFFWCGELWWFGLGWRWWQVVGLQKKCRGKRGEPGGGV